jgi:branched-chain amino acid transport system ATP-binding protein
MTYSTLRSAPRGLRQDRGLKGVDLDINAGEIVALIGANGAGKSTLMMTIFGRPRARSGRIEFDGQDITGVPAQRSRGCASPNPEAAGFSAHERGGKPADGADATDQRGRAANGLEHVRAVSAAEGAHDPARRHAVRRRTADAGDRPGPDEPPTPADARRPSLGLAPLIARQIFDAIRTLNRQDGLTVLIVEQNANHALKLAHRGYVMVNGLITLSGTGSERCSAPEIRAAYLEGGRRNSPINPGRDPGARCGKMRRTDSGFARKLPMTSP